MNQLKIAIIGAGAIGAYYGGRLAQHGRDVHFLLRSEYETVKQHGWRIRSCNGDFVLPAEKLKVYRDAREMPKCDLVIVTLKSTANDQLEPLIAPLVRDETIILTLQNGLGNEERLAELFGARRVLGGMAFTCINRVAPGEVQHTDHGLIRIGEMNGPATARVRRVAEMFNASKVQCEALDDLRLGRWTKLIWNIPFNGLGAVLDKTTDQLLADAQGEALVRSIMEEVVAAARGANVTLSADLIDRNISNTHTMGAYHTSTQLDRRLGRAMEIEAIFGRPLEVAREAGIATPRLEMLYRMIRLIDPGRANAR